MELSTVYMCVGFLLAAYSVIANDSVQTLGTWLASNSERFSWYKLWAPASIVLLFTIWFGWVINDGDISYGRLTNIPFQEVQWYHAVAPLILVILTKVGVPVSTTFLVLSAFASGVVFEKMLIKSALGYVVSATVAYAIWLVVSRWLETKTDILFSQDRWWRVGQWVTTGGLWFMWLSHDMANIAVFLPRDVPVGAMIVISVVFVSGLAYMFWERGGKIQQVVLSKVNTKYVRSATLVDLVYAIILYVFKELNSIPMSTTWVFLGLLAGRELAIATALDKTKIKKVFPLLTKDFFKLMLGLTVSTLIVLCIHFK